MVQGLEGGGLGIPRRLTVHGQEIDRKHARGVGLVVDSLGTVLALYEQLDAPSNTMGLNDADDGAHVVEDLRLRLIDVLALCHREEPAVAVQGLLDRFHRTRPAGRDRDCDPGIDHGVSQREYRK